MKIIKVTDTTNTYYIPISSIVYIRDRENAGCAIKLVDSPQEYFYQESASYLARLINFGVVDGN